ncbi:MAG TPA: hypothetical protein PLZ49_06780 [Bacillota bacterium]|nr:hypothetical protein [Bacillota bacterium]
MKKIFLVLLAVTLLFSVSACSNTGSEQVLEGDLESILDKIYESSELSEDFKEYTLPGLITSEITEENCEYHLGKSGLEYEEAIVSEPEMMGSPYALCLVRAKEGADIEKLKSEIKENVNPNKWVCVGVDPSNIIVDNIGDLVILIMSDTDARALHSAFLALAK